MTWANEGRTRVQRIKNIIILFYFIFWIIKNNTTLSLDPSSDSSEPVDDTCSNLFVCYHFFIELGTLWSTIQLIYSYLIKSTSVYNISYMIFIFYFFNSYQLALIILIIIFNTFLFFSFLLIIYIERNRYKR